MKKICTTCGIEKELEEYNLCKKGKYGRAAKCRDCRKKLYAENRVEVLKSNKIYRDKNKDKSKQYRLKNKKYFSDKGKEWRILHSEESSENFKKYYQEHPEYFKHKKKEYAQSEKGKAAKRAWCNNYNKKNKHIVLWRSLLRRTIVQLKYEKNGSTKEMLGYDAIELKEHIEKNWLEGMDWENYGEWHVDHIKSVASFTSDTPASVVNSLSNLRPMWATTRIINGQVFEGNLNKGKN